MAANSMGDARVAVVGSFNVDHVWRVASLPQAGATFGGDYASGPGGKAKAAIRKIPLIAA